MTDSYRGRRVLVTGGLGFIGSALSTALVNRGAVVRVLDSLLPQFGGSPRNLSGVANRVEVVIEDTRNRDAVNRSIDGIDVVFHFAAAAGPGAGTADFYSDLDIACLGTWHVLEAVRHVAPRARVVFASSQYVYAPDCALPADEDTPLTPDTMFGVHKLAGERYVGLYASSFGMDTVVARLTSVYGEGQRLQAAGDGSLARMLDAALHDEDVWVYDGGQQRWDLLHVEDAVRGLLLLGEMAAARGRTLNLASGVGVTQRAAAEAIVAATGRGRVRDALHDDGFADRIVRDFVADVRRLRALGVPAPPRPFEARVREVAQWYRGGAA